jgi:signal peptidase II
MACSATKTCCSPRTATAVVFTIAALGVAALDLWSKKAIFDFLEVESAPTRPSAPDSPPYVKSQRTVSPGDIGERQHPRLEFGHVLVKDLFWLQANYNYGAFSGWFSEHTGALTLLSALAVLALVAITVFHLRSRSHPDLAFVIALGLLLGGTLGNLYDRALLHAVRDWILWFVVIDGEAYRWPNFNVADSAICTGVGLLILLEVLRWRREARAAKAGGAAAAEVTPKAS